MGESLVVRIQLEECLAASLYLCAVHVIVEKMGVQFGRLIGAGVFDRQFGKQSRGKT